MPRNEHIRTCILICFFYFWRFDELWVQNDALVRTVCLSYSASYGIWRKRWTALRRLIIFLMCTTFLPTTCCINSFLVTYETRFSIEDYIFFYFFCPKSNTHTGKRKKMQIWFFLSFFSIVEKMTRHWTAMYFCFFICIICFQVYVCCQL